MEDEVAHKLGLNASGKFLSNQLLEFLALRLLCSDDSSIRAKSLALFRSDYFYGKDSKKAITRIKTMASKTGHQMTWRELTNDPVLSKHFRSRLRSYIGEGVNEKKAVREKLKKRLKEAKKLKLDVTTNTKIEHTATVEVVAKLLDDYGRTRLIWDFLKRTVAAKDSGEFDVDKVYDDLKTTTSKAQVSFDEEEVFKHIGIKDNVEELVDSVLKGVENLYIPTGIADFDIINQGFIRGSMVMLAATTGGGKSTMSLQLAINAAKAGAKVCYVPLEMTPFEMTQRKLANLSGISITRLLNPAGLTEKEKKHIKKCYTDFSELLQKRGGQISMFNPSEDMDMDAVLYYLKPHNYDMIIVDYIGLLGGVSGDDQWKTLGNAARSAKVFALRNNNVVVCVAQLSEEGLIRYSRAMQEHSNLTWYWSYNSAAAAAKESEYGELDYEDKVVTISMPKSRNQKAIPLKVYMDFDKMQVRDYDPDGKRASRKDTSSNKPEPEDDDYFGKEEDDNPFSNSDKGVSDKAARKALKEGKKGFKKTDLEKSEKARKSKRQASNKKKLDKSYAGLKKSERLEKYGGKDKKVIEAVDAFNPDDRFKTAFKEYCKKQKTYKRAVHIQDKQDFINGIRLKFLYEYVQGRIGIPGDSEKDETRAKEPVKRLTPKEKRAQDKKKRSKGWG